MGFYRSYDQTNSVTELKEKMEPRNVLLLHYVSISFLLYMILILHLMFETIIIMFKLT